MEELQTFPLAMIYPSIDNFPRHPSQLYEAFFEGIFLFLILILIYNKKFLNNNFGIASAVFLIYLWITSFFYRIFKRTR